MHHISESRVVIQIQLNGEAVEVAPGTLEQLLAERGWTGKRVAIERNGAIVPRSLYPGTRVQSGDALEIVVAVGGG
jgi:sulfur carrier protein